MVLCYYFHFISFCYRSIFLLVCCYFLFRSLFFCIRVSHHFWLIIGHRGLDLQILRTSHSTIRHFDHPSICAQGNGFKIYLKAKHQENESDIEYHSTVWIKIYKNRIFELLPFATLIQLIYLLPYKFTHGPYCEGMVSVSYQNKLHYRI